MKKIIFFLLLCFLASCASYKKNSNERKCHRIIKRSGKLIAKIKEDCADCIDSTSKIVKLDSTIKSQTVSGEIDIKPDSSGTHSMVSDYTDSLKALLKQNQDHKKSNEELNSQIDFLEKQLEAKIYNKINNQRIIPSPIQGDTLDLKFKIWQDNNKIKYSFTKKEQSIHLEKKVDTLEINCPETEIPFYKNRWFWLFVSTLIILILILIRR